LPTPVAFRNDLALSSIAACSMGTGQANVKAYNRHLCDLIFADRAKPSWIVSHELSLSEAPEAYKNFDVRAAGWTKVVLHPSQRGPKEQKKTAAGHRVLAQSR
jgi:glutathione-independent formaldehyde dehydrogenase